MSQKPLLRNSFSKIVKCVYTGLETLVIFLGDEKSIEGFVDSLVVEVLDRPQVRLDELEVIVLGEEVHSPRVITDTITTRA